MTTALPVLFYVFLEFRVAWNRAALEGEGVICHLPLSR